MKRRIIAKLFEQRTRRSAAQVVLGYTIVVGWLAMCSLLWSCPAAAETRAPLIELRAR